MLRRPHAHLSLRVSSPHIPLLRHTPTGLCPIAHPRHACDGRCRPRRLCLPSLSRHPALELPFGFSMPVGHYSSSVHRYIRRHWEPPVRPPKPLGCLLSLLLWRRSTGSCHPSVCKLSHIRHHHPQTASFLPQQVRNRCLPPTALATSASLDGMSRCLWYRDIPMLQHRGQASVRSHP